MTMMETHLSHSGPMSQAATQPASFEAWQALVAPGDVFRRPQEVLAHPLMSQAEKRTILAAWASDACALENAPGLRCLAGCRAEPVSLDAVLNALAALDQGSPGETIRCTNTLASPRRRLQRFLNLRRHIRPGRRNDDDDPPPCPAAVMPRPPKPPSAAALALSVPA
ncbi:hypothetical protein CRT23_22835 [Methylobacterium sp. V23]|nr:hypothetical protein [Methylobacterium sp. V23]POR40600.1 hypothetical protein CRT23_22835 [Methylobacterium sp. V23]